MNMHLCIFISDANASQNSTLHNVLGDLLPA